MTASAPAPQATARPQTGPAAHRWRVLAGLWGLYFCFGLGFTGISPLVPVIEADLDMSSTQMGLVLGSWQAVYVFAAIPAAVLILRRGAVPALGLAGALVLGSLVLRGLATDFPTLLVSVAMLGLGGPVISIGAPILVGELFGARSVAFAMGAYITAPALANILTFALSGPVLLPLAGGDWRLVLLGWAGVAALILAGWSGLCARGRRLGPPAGEAGGRWLPARTDAGLVALICLAGVMILFITHGFGAWAPEIARAAGYPLGLAGVVAAASMGMGLLALLSVPSLVGGAVSFPRVTLALALLIAIGCLAMMRAPAGPVFAWAMWLTGFAVGPLLTLGLMPLVTHRAFSAAQRVMVIALFFALAEIGGTLGPTAYGALRDLTGGFGGALALTAAAALATVVCLYAPARRLDMRGGEAAEHA